MKIRWREPLDLSLPLLTNALIVDADPLAPIVADGTGIKGSTRIRLTPQEQQKYMDYLRLIFTE